MTTPLKLSLLHVDAATLDRRHQQYSPMVSWVSRNVTSKEVTMVSWVSRNDASKEVTPPVTLSSLIQELDRAFAKRTTYNGEVDLEDNTPSGKMTPKGATAIAVSETDGTDFHLEQPNRSHCTRQTTPGKPAISDSKGWYRHRTTLSHRVGMKPSRRRIHVDAPPHGRAVIVATQVKVALPHRCRNL